jgi:hypothetical protein
MQRLFNFLTVSVAFIAAMLVGGCAVLQGGAGATESSEPNLRENRTVWEQRVTDRANQRWAYIKEKKFEQAHAFFTASSKKDFTAEMLGLNIRNRGMFDGKVDRVECGDEKCEVWVNVSLTIYIQRVGNKQQIVPFKEDWVIEKGEFHLLRQQ